MHLRTSGASSYGVGTGNSWQCKRMPFLKYCRRIKYGRVAVWAKITGSANLLALVVFVCRPPKVAVNSSWLGPNLALAILENAVNYLVSGFPCKSIVFCRIDTD